MKKIKILGLFITLILLFPGCEELKDPAGQRNVAVAPAITDVSPEIFDSKDLENSYIQFTVEEVTGTHIDKVTIMGSYAGNLERVKIQEITTFPTTVRVLSSDAAQKLGIALADIHNGDVFTFELLTEANGITTYSNSVLNISVACAFDRALAIGSYHSVSSDWATDGSITITSDAADPYTVYVAGLEALDGLVEDKGPLVMHINPGNYAVTADITVLASDVSWGGYHNIAYEGTGTYNSCDGSYTMIFDITVDEGSFGKNAFTFTRNTK